MTTAKIEFSFGSLSFAGEGTEAWLSAQLDKLLKAAPSLSELKVQAAPVAPAPTGSVPEGAHSPTAPFTASLASYIKSKGGDSNQVKRFLATADWLRQKGISPLTTAAVGKALLQHHQKKLANPSDCLGKLVGKGFCEKHGDGFFITPDGLKDMGHG